MYATNFRRGLSAFCLMMLIGWAVPARADCPDLVSCNLYGGGDEYSPRVGTISVATCYKFGKGCRPWHCDHASDTNRDYWTAQCMQKFSQCTQEKGCTAIFPGALNQ